MAESEPVVILAKDNVVAFRFDSGQNQWVECARGTLQIHDISGHSVVRIVAETGAAFLNHCLSKGKTMNLAPDSARRRQVQYQAYTFNTLELRPKFRTLRIRFPSEQDCLDYISMLRDRVPQREFSVKLKELREKNILEVNEGSKSRLKLC